MSFLNPAVVVGRVVCSAENHQPAMQDKREPTVHGSATLCAPWLEA